MNQIVSDISINEGNIRKVFHQGEWYYNATDFIAHLLDTDYKRAKNYYHVLKKRLSQNGELIPQLRKLKVQAADGKRYFTDFVGSYGIQMLHEYLEPRIRTQSYRMDIRQDDEVAFFHPKVQAHLEQVGWDVEHHVKLPSGNTIDFIAKSLPRTCVIECKPKLHNSNLYHAIGQVLCYQSEFDPQAIPVIATYASSISNYVRFSCSKLHIGLIEIEED